MGQRLAARAYQAVVSILHAIGFYAERNVRYSGLILERLAGRVAPDEIVLDIGCGPGAVTEGITGTYNVVGVDLDRFLLSHFQDARARRVQASAEKLPFKAQSVGAAIVVSLMEHLPDREAFLREAGRVLKPGGICILQLPELRFLLEPHTKWPLLFAMNPAFQRTILTATGYDDLQFSATIDEICEIAPRAGFTTPQVTPIWHFRLARLLGMPMGYVVVTQRKMPALAEGRWGKGVADSP